jgi:hypothetical protein
LASATELTCRKIFSEQIESGRGRASFEGNRFFMRFAGLDESQGFHRAALIVNEIGSRILGDRFHTMEIPWLVVAVDAADITAADGSLNLERVEAAVQRGGRPVAMDEPGAEAPEWVRLRWKRRLAGSDADQDDPMWTELTPEQRGTARASGGAGSERDPSGWIQRIARERRKQRQSFAGKDRRKRLDRRGRGF